MVPVVLWPAVVLLLALAFMEPELFSILSNLAVVTEAKLLVLSILVMTTINEMFS